MNLTHKRGAGLRLNDEQRLQILDLVEQPSSPSLRNIGRQFGVSESAIRSLIKKKDEIRLRAQQKDHNARKKTFRGSKGKYPELEERLYAWIDASRRLSIVLPPSVIMEKARRLGSEMNISEDDFKATWGWFKKFRHRQCLNTINLYGEGGAVDRNDPELLASLERLYAIVNEYDPNNVYNMDETGLFFRLAPRYTMLLPSEDPTTIRGKKKLLDRVTLVVCCNATGTEKVPITMIGKAKEPACIVGNSWPLPYVAQRNAWIDIPCFNKWFDQVFVPFVRSRTNRKVLLILDNAPGHAQAFERDAIKVIFFPANVTSWKQPMDMGIIAALKKRYKYHLIREILAYHDSPDCVKIRLEDAAKRMRRGSIGLAFGKSPHLLDAANLIVTAWNEIKQETIFNCYRKADIISSFRANDVDLQDGEMECIDDLVALLCNCNLLENVHVEEIRDEIMECVNADSNESEKLNQNLLEEIDEVITQASNANEPLAYDENNSDSEFVEIQDMHGCLKEEDVIIPELLKDIVDCELKLNSITTTTYLSSEKAKQVQSALSSARRIIQETNSAIVSKRIAKSRQMTLRDFGMK